MRVLVVEDDPEISRFVVRGLTRGALPSWTWSRTARPAIDMACAEEYDAIVLDLMLPGVDGFEVCRQLRGTGRGHAGDHGHGARRACRIASPASMAAPTTTW